YNFSGDVGKAGVAAGIGLLAGLIGWRWAGATYGLVGVAAALVIVPLLSRVGAGGSVVRAAHDPPLPAGWGIRDGRGFSALCAIGMIDNATRTGFLTFMPFILIAKEDRKSTRLNSSHRTISYAVFCLKKKKNMHLDASS